MNLPVVTNTTYNINEAPGINELTTEQISMYPNPAASTIRFNGANVTSAQIYDMTGKQLLQAGEVINNEVSVANLANGIYQVIITTTNGMHTQKRVIRK